MQLRQLFLTNTHREEACFALVISDWAQIMTVLLVGSPGEPPNRANNGNALENGCWRNFYPFITLPIAVRLLVSLWVPSDDLQGCHRAGDEKMGLQWIKISQSTLFLLRFSHFSRRIILILPLINFQSSENFNSDIFCQFSHCFSEGKYFQKSLTLVIFTKILWIKFKAPNYPNQFNKHISHPEFIWQLIKEFSFPSR